MTKKTESGVGALDVHRTESIGFNYFDSSWISFAIATNLHSHSDYAQQVTMSKLWSLWLSLISSSD